MKLKSGDWVKFKDGDPNKYQVIWNYGKGRVSLGLANYPDVEQDNQINVNKLVKVESEVKEVIVDLPSKTIVEVRELWKQLKKI